MQPSAIAVITILSFSIIGAASGKELVLETSKDTFARSNEQIKNSGGSSQLLVASAPMVRTLIAFDLSGVTNRIEGAELRFRLKNSMPSPITLVIAPMKQTRNNAAWGEGIGDLGAIGQNSRIGEACFARSAYTEVMWESAEGVSAVNLNDSSLWEKPVETLDRFQWVEGKWARVVLKNPELLEQIRNSEIQTVTFGLWGTAGNGTYAMNSKEAGEPAKLILTLPDDKPAKQAVQ